MGMANTSLVKVDGGYLTIPQITSVITVTHNLGVAPNFAAIWVDGTDYDIIPFGYCVEGTYQCNDYISNGSYSNINGWYFRYAYKHATSGNLLQNTYSLGSTQFPTASEFKFVKGGADWAASDTNGNPLRYRWVVGYMPIGE